MISVWPAVIPYACGRNDWLDLEWAHASLGQLCSFTKTVTTQPKTECSSHFSRCCCSSSKGLWPWLHSLPQKKSLSAAGLHPMRLQALGDSFPGCRFPALVPMLTLQRSFNNWMGRGRWFLNGKYDYHSIIHIISDTIWIIVTHTMDENLEAL